MDVDPSEVKNEEEKEMEAAEEEEEEDLNSYQLRVLPFCHDLHQKHGLRHNDYQR